MSGELPRPDAIGSKEIDRKILEIFRSRDGGVVSGEELSRSLDVSRTAVWKHIKTLNGLGYRIEAVPSRGYRLVSTPDILTPAELSVGLNVARIGTSLVFVGETDSTNTLAYRLAEDGAVEGTVVIADAQNRGRGRLGRQWESPAGVNLYCSIVLRPPIMPLHAPQLTFLSAVAVAEAIERSAGLAPVIKWPNDVLVNGFKVAGMLNEMSAETERIDFLVLGIGVNINMQRDQFPADLRHPASSLAIEAGHEVSRLSFTRALLESLDVHYSQYRAEGYAPLRQAWLGRSAVMGRRVRVSGNQGDMAGTVEGIDEIGALLLRTADGTLERVLAGDVTIEE
ncbi:biotin--[acetyl-CoA-carboxylase] ligase [Geobacter hydrogenophilus]|uniref:Bifunctional ligase/repressor BirA n=1 Tax=Geobacter hydrogenophilus TaxID=40983 RepID=A0A9W6G1M4_9BACT|nr:biotin--[acetyl-CoA-carboxylase] ligase [Geobacter hydrogenophilus]MBT0892950.1 biotin--[acetyl-CoA-carboxylase] ligase [Geobacter hydrogenophilus]GLI39214.1 bifunctional ligase/repressor BirA [Geobacter hydrogenophilus]